MIMINNNAAEISSSPGEILHFSDKYYVSGRKQTFFWPINFLGSPIARMFHNCYWLSSSTVGESVKLMGPSKTGQFRQIQIYSGEAVYINPEFFAGVILQGGKFTTILNRFFNPHCWILGKPLPVIVRGPAILLVYSEQGIEEVASSSRQEFSPGQIISFDATKKFKSKPIDVPNHLYSILNNIVSTQCNWEFEQETKIYYTPVNVGKNSWLTPVAKLILHMAIFATALYFSL